VLYSVSAFIEIRIELLNFKRSILVIAKSAKKLDILDSVALTFLRFALRLVQLEQWSSGSIPTSIFHCCNVAMFQMSTENVRCLMSNVETKTFVTTQNEINRWVLLYGDLLLGQRIQEVKSKSKSQVNLNCKL
jgi:hypothetical protein